MSRQLFEEARRVLTQEAAVKLDPVGQEDKDIDNDGDSDKTDSYLKKRRGAISAAIAKGKNESKLSEEDIAKLKAILGEMKDKEEIEDEEEQVEEAYTGKNPHNIKTISSGGAGKIVAITNAGARHEISAKDTGGKMPKTGEHIGKYVKIQEEQVDEAKLNPAGKSAVKDVAKKIGTKTLGQTKAIVALAKQDPKKVKEEVEQVDEGDLGAQFAAFAKQKGIKATAPMTKAQSDVALKARAEKFKQDNPTPRQTEPYKEKYPLGGRDEKSGRSYSEEVEQIDEVGDTPSGKQMLGRYIQKATRRVGVHSAQAADYAQTAGDETVTPAQRMAATTLAAKQKQKRDMRVRGVERATDKLTKEEVEQVDEAGRIIKGKGYDNPENMRKAPEGDTKITSMMPGFDERAARFLARQAKGTLVKGKAQSAPQKEDVDYEIIEKMNFQIPEAPSFNDYLQAALKIAECKSLSDLSEEDQQYIIAELEEAVANNDIEFIIEAEALSDMNDTVQRLRKAGHKVEDMGKDYRGNPYYVYVDKSTNLRRKVIYKNGQKMTQNMGRAAPDQEEN